MPTAAVISTSRWVILGLLVALVLRPFAEGLWQDGLGWLRWLDELGVVVLVAAASWVRWWGQGRRLSGERYLVGALAVFFAASAASAAINGVGVRIAALGTGDYVKALGFLYAAAILDAPILRRRVLLTLQTLGWLAVAFTLGESLLYNLITNHPEAMSDELFGLEIVKPNGLLRHPNLSGLFVSLAMIAATTVGRGNDATIATHWLACTASLSRMLHIVMIVVLAAISRGRRWVLILAGISVLFLALAYQRTTRELEHTYQPGTEELPYHYRTFARQRALEVLRDHPVLGAGPGRFGGVVSVTHGSPLYERYPFPSPHDYWLSQLRSLDSFYPQLLAELGVLGALAWSGLAGLILWLLWRRRRDEPWAWAGTLAVVVVAIYCLGAGLNISSYLAPAMVIAGLGLAVPPGPGSALPPGSDSAAGQEPVSAAAQGFGTAAEDG